MEWDGSFLHYLGFASVDNGILPSCNGIARSRAYGALMSLRMEQRQMYMDEREYVSADE